MSHLQVLLLLHTNTNYTDIITRAMAKTPRLHCLTAPRSPTRLYKAIKATLGRSDDAVAFINWVSDSIEDPHQALSFARHFAVCLTPLDFWNDPTRSLAHTFENATYHWELIRPDLVPNECDIIGSNIDKIRGRDGMIEVSCTTYDDAV